MNRKILDMIDNKWVMETQVTFSHHESDEELKITFYQNDRFKIFLKEGTDIKVIEDESNSNIFALGSAAQCIDRDRIKRIIIPQKQWKKFGIDGEALYTKFMEQNLQIR